MLTPKQARFVDEYLIDLCATKAAIRAGYSKKRADAIGYENLRKPEIKKAIQERQKALRDKLEISQEKVLREYAKVAFYDVRTLFDNNSRLINIKDLDDNSAAIIAGVDNEELFEGKGKDRVRAGTLRKIKFLNKLDALEALGKHLGLFAADNKQKGDATSEGEVRALSSLERAARVMALVRIAKKRAAEAKEGS